VARYYKREFDVDLYPESEVLPLLGSKEGLMNLSLAVLSPGDVVLNPTPSYPTYEQGGIMTEAEVFHMPLIKENNFFPDLNAIPEDIAQRARILWLNYPNNPTGAMCSVDDYARAVAFCAKYDILLASDNPYFAVVFDGPFAPSALPARKRSGRMSAAVQATSAPQSWPTITASRSPSVSRSAVMSPTRWKSVYASMGSGASVRP
jgi:LL-diaminopimelate aminotransferase